MWRRVTQNKIKVLLYLIPRRCDSMNDDLPDRSVAPGYNLAKYRVLTAVAVCQYVEIPATTYSLHVLTGYKRDTVSTYVNHNYENYLLTRHIKRSPDRCRLKHRLNKKGERALRAYNERKKQGYDLNIRRVPRRCDWSGIKLLPGIDELDRLVELYEDF